MRAGRGIRVRLSMMLAGLTGSTAGEGSRKRLEQGVERRRAVRKFWMFAAVCAAVVVLSGCGWFRKGSDAGQKGGVQRARSWTTYEVEEGDSLWKIAALKDVYGDGTQWERIAEVNNIDSPSDLKIGQILRIPRD